MDVLTAIKGRRSVRSFLSREIEPEKIASLKEALIWAPSAGNLQSRFFYFLSDQRKKEKLAEAAYEQYFISEAPLAVVGCADARIKRRYGGRGVELYSIQDVACSVENMMLLAHTLGLGSVWVGSFNEAGVSEVLGIPEHLRPVSIVPVGYPEEVPDAPERVPEENIILDLG